MTRRRYDAIVIGGGVNGLACAALLGQAGLRTLLVERRADVGGCAAEHELTPGFRVPTLAHRTGPVRADLVEQLRLTEHGLSFVHRPVRVTALATDGRVLALHAQPHAAADAIRPWSARDAERWPAFAHSLDRLGAVIGQLFTRVPPDLVAPSPADAWTAMRTLGAFRSLPREDQWRLLRWGPMAVADVVSEVFETELLRAAVAADGLLGAMLGPWSAGSGLQLLFHAANASLGALPDAEVEGGPAALARALAAAARRHGVEIRTGTGVSRVVVAHDRVAGVVFDNGDTADARAVVSGLDPRRTMLSLCDADHLPPEFLWRIRHLRMRGTLAKVNLALSALPVFGDATKAMLAGLVRIAPDLEYLERAFDHAKYGAWSPEPWVEFTIPSLLDRSLAPDGAHVLSAYVQWVGTGQQAPGGRQQAEGAAPGDAAPREAILGAVIRTLEQYAPGIGTFVVAAEVITPSDMERDWGLTGGHIFHGELSLDQAFTMRPLLGVGRYAMPLPGLFLCGSGTHPGTGLTGGSGANAARAVIDALT